MFVYSKLFDNWTAATNWLKTAGLARTFSDIHAGVEYWEDRDYIVVVESDSAVPVAQVYTK